MLGIIPSASASHAPVTTDPGITRISGWSALNYFSVLVPLTLGTIPSASMCHFLLTTVKVI
jgi:hypothetical protein